jgi:hypothetical protein
VKGADGEKRNGGQRGDGGEKATAGVRHGRKRGDGWMSRAEGIYLSIPVNRLIKGKSKPRPPRLRDVWRRTVVRQRTR